MKTPTVTIHEFPNVLRVVTKDNRGRSRTFKIRAIDCSDPDRSFSNVISLYRHTAEAKAWEFVYERFDAEGRAIRNRPARLTLI